MAKHKHAESKRSLVRKDSPPLPAFKAVLEGRHWSFDGNSVLFRLLPEANCFRLAYLFDPLLAVHTSLTLIDPNETEVRYVRIPFEKDSDFSATSANDDQAAFRAQAQEPA